MLAAPNLGDGAKRRVQGLIYMFIGLAGVAVGAAAYFGFTFTPIEAFVAALLFVAVATLLMERTLRRRAEGRLERAIEDLSRLLSTDAQAGAVLGQRINALVDEEAGKRLEVVEADISVLGTVVRQVAEAVADLEEARRRDARRERDRETALAIVPAPQSVPQFLSPRQDPAPAMPPPEPEPAVSLERLKQALDDNRLIFHIQPIVTLPQRRAQAYDLVPRLMLDDGELAEAADFMPRRGGEAVVRRIERLCVEEAVTISRRARTGGQPVTLYVPISRATLVDAIAIEKLVLLLEANRAVAAGLVLTVAEADWSAMPLNEKAALAAFVGKGVGLSLAGARSLRLDFAELAAVGVHSIRVDAGRFIDFPERFTDFHSSDVTSYVKRFDIDLIATGIHTEQQILTLLDDGVALVQGPHIAGPGPVRPDLLVHRLPGETTPRRAEA
jgi:cyclic-di-GMP phosphodiesterase TipF (flagellum assembly factor)